MKVIKIFLLLTGCSAGFAVANNSERWHSDAKLVLRSEGTGPQMYYLTRRSGKRPPRAQGGQRNPAAKLDPSAAFASTSGSKSAGTQSEDTTSPAKPSYQRVEVGSKGPSMIHALGQQTKIRHVSPGRWTVMEDAHPHIAKGDIFHHGHPPPGGENQHYRFHENRALAGGRTAMVKVTAPQGGSGHIKTVDRSGILDTPVGPGETKHKTAFAGGAEVAYAVGSATAGGAVHVAAIDEKPENVPDSLHIKNA